MAAAIYVFPDMPPGIYTISVEVTGFKLDTRKDVALLVNTSQRIDVQLQPGSVTETVEVTAARRCCKRIAPIPAGPRLDRGANRCR